MSRELYDLCRKYKYFYKKLRILKEADEKVYDKYLKRAVVSTEGELSIIEHDLSNYMLSNAIKPYEITMETSFTNKPCISDLEMRGVFSSSFFDWLHSNPCGLADKMMNPDRFGRDFWSR